eukprot:m.345069 g.345069  ORF g.345069 m.345069 type:complete len:631 (-) comp25714_c0_seq1:117-2009(-)
MDTIRMVIDYLKLATLVAVLQLQLTSTTISKTPEERACSLFCDSQLLKDVELSQLFNDSKTFVDRPLLDSPEAVLEKYENLTSSGKALNRSQLLAFVEENFGEEGDDLEPWIPSDWEPNPPILQRLATNVSLMAWAKGLHDLWKELGRQTSGDVTQHPERHTLLRAPNGLVVPGGRFRETYYWDTLWIVHGLIVSNMVNTSMGVVGNLLHFCNRFGFVPNGGRVYYLTRSQPPMLTDMVTTVYDALIESNRTKAASTWLSKALPTLVTEMQFWQQNRTGFCFAKNDSVTLARYGSCEDGSPRPESYFEDFQVAKLAQGRENIFRDIIAGAETGWDFSSRWFANGINMTTIVTTEILPVDLNSILLRAELLLYRLHTIMNNTADASKLMDSARKRLSQMDSLMWKEQDGCWMDYSAGKVSANGPAASSYLPLWALSLPEAKLLPANSTKIQIAVRSLNASGLVASAGLVTTLENTGQQWDSPNAWAPLVQMITEGLLAAGTKDALANELGHTLMSRWIETNFIAWNRSGFMYEKYNAYKMGSGGGGGEYVPQRGFGWTNGVALMFLKNTVKERNTTSVPSHTVRPKRITTTVLVSIILGGVVFLSLVVLASYKIFFRKNKAVYQTFQPNDS